MFFGNGFGSVFLFVLLWLGVVCGKRGFGVGGVLSVVVGVFG